MPENFRNHLWSPERVLDDELVNIFSKFLTVLCVLSKCSNISVLNLSVKYCTFTTGTFVITENLKTTLLHNRAKLSRIILSVNKVDDMNQLSYG